jgi:hypothetical protein
VGVIVIVVAGEIVGVVEIVWSARIIVGDIEGCGPDALDLLFVWLCTVRTTTGIAANSKRIANIPTNRKEKKELFRV